MNDLAPNPRQERLRAEERMFDPLSRYPRSSALLVALLAAGLLLASLLGDTERGLPTLAFEWQFGLDLIRAAVAFTIIGLVLLLVVRGWNGVWPQRFSHEGLDYSDAAAGAELQESGLREATELLKELRKVRT